MCCCSRYLLQYQEPIPCEQLVTALCDIKQAYTQFGGTNSNSLVRINVRKTCIHFLWFDGISSCSTACESNILIVCVCVSSGKRPFGVSLLYMGWDKHYGFQLYQSDPSGNYGGWKATCIGNNSAVSLTETPWSSCSGNTLNSLNFKGIYVQQEYLIVFRLKWGNNETAVPLSVTRGRTWTHV